MSIIKNITLLGSSFSKNKSISKNDNSQLMISDQSNNNSAKWNPKYYLIKCKYFEMTAIA